MGKVQDLINSLRVAEDGMNIAYPDTFRDDILAAYDEDMSYPTSALEVARQEIAAKDAEILQLKAHNYELIIGARDGVDEIDESGDDIDTDNEDDDGPTGMDRIFKEKED